MALVLDNCTFHSTIDNLKSTHLFHASKSFISFVIDRLRSHLVFEFQVQHSRYAEANPETR